MSRASRQSSAGDTKLFQISEHGATRKIRDDVKLDVGGCLEINGVVLHLSCCARRVEEELLTTECHLSEPSVRRTSQDELLKPLLFPILEGQSISLIASADRDRLICRSSVPRPSPTYPHPRSADRCDARAPRTAFNLNVTTANHSGTRWPDGFDKVLANRHRFARSVSLLDRTEGLRGLEIGSLV